MAATVDITSLIDGQKIGLFQLRVAALCAAVVFMDGFDAQAIGYVAPSLAKDWRLAPGALGPVFAAGLFGLMLGALAAGPIADRVGRKPVIVFCAFFFGVFALLTATAGSMASLLAWRFVTGLGLGGAMPSAIALTSEYSPRRSRATMIMVMFCGFSLGSALGGVLAARLLPAWGWTSVFWVGGILPIALVPALLGALPESIRFLALEGAGPERIATLLRRIDPAGNAAAREPSAKGVVYAIGEVHPPGFPVRHLFRDGRGGVTALFWTIFFMNLLDIYFLANWLPTVINGAGISVSMAAIATALLQVGGILGTLTLGRLIDRMRPFDVLAVTYLLAAVFIACIGIAGSSIRMIMLFVLGAGFCVVGAQIGANALAAMLYPTFVRSTGVGWALGIGRIGSIVGPLVGGAMLAVHWPIPTIFLAGAVPALIAALAAFAMGCTGRQAAAQEARRPVGHSPSP